MQPPIDEKESSGLLTERLRESEERFRTMANVAPVLLWMSGPDGLCTFFNQTWLDFTGRSPEDEWGIGWAEGVHFEDLQRCLDTYVDAFNQRKVFSMEYRLRRADGEYRWVLDRGTPRYTPDGTFAGYIGSCTDISDQKRLEADLHHAVRARDEFLSIASHELRTPLTSLLLRIEVLQRHSLRIQKVERIDLPAKEDVAALMDQTLRLASLVNVLLDVSRIAEGHLCLDYDELDAGALLKDIVGRLRDQASTEGCSLTVTVDGQMRARWDRMRIEQVITNVLSNAFKYGRGKPVEVVLTYDRTGDRGIVFQVTDHGVGIAPEHVPHLFERFSRFVPTRHYGGLGLGLWISRQIVEAHEGRITASSEPGKGTTFTVHLPIRPAAELPAGEARPAHASELHQGRASQVG